VIEVEIEGHCVKVTPNHKFYASCGGNHAWISAGELKVSDELRTFEGGWVKVTRVEDKGEVVTVFNLRVANDQTYFVGKREWGFAVLVHNESIKVRNGKVYWVVEQDGWTHDWDSIRPLLIAHGASDPRVKRVGFEPIHAGVERNGPPCRAASQFRRGRTCVV
jgi:hypothetical protein